jgi:hypothetical protein
MSADAIRVSGAPTAVELAAVLAALRSSTRGNEANAYERWRRVRLATATVVPRR